MNLDQPRHQEIAYGILSSLAHGPKTGGEIVEDLKSRFSPSEVGPIIRDLLLMRSISYQDYYYSKVDGRTYSAVRYL